MFGFLHFLAFFAVLRSNPLGRNSERCMVGEYACPLYRSVNVSRNCCRRTSYDSKDYAIEHSDGCTSLSVHVSFGTKGWIISVHDDFGTYEINFGTGVGI